MKTQVLVLISTSWPKRVGRLGPWLSSLIGGAHPLGLRPPRRSAPYKGGGGTRNRNPVRVSAHSPHLSAHRSGGAMRDKKHHSRRRSPLRFTDNLHGTAQRRWTPSAQTRSSSSTYSPRWISVFVPSSLPHGQSRESHVLSTLLKRIPTDLHLNGSLETNNGIGE
jgi:hypothetical protein